MKGSGILKHVMKPFKRQAVPNKWETFFMSRNLKNIIFQLADNPADRVVKLFLG